MDPDTKTIVAFGDSITLAKRQPKEKKWVFILEDSLNREFSHTSFKVINSGVGGNTSREGLARIDQDVLVYKPDYITVEFGGNDATFEPERHVDFMEFAENLEKIRTQILKVNPDAVLIMCTFPPIIDEQHCFKDHEFYKKFGGGDNLVEKYREITRNFAEKHNCPLADLGKILRDKDNPNRLILTDGVHLTEAGNFCVAENIFKTFKNILN